MHVRHMRPRRLPRAPTESARSSPAYAGAGPRGDDAHDACRTRAPAHMNLAVRNRPLVPIRTRHSCRYSSGHDILRKGLDCRPLHLYLHESLLLTQHALSLLLRSLKKQIHAGLQNRSIRRLRPASRTAMTATTQSPAIATKFLLLKSCRKAQQLPYQHFL